MNDRVERLYVWCGIAGMALLFLGLGVARLLPPPSPSEGAEQITSFYRAHVVSLRWGSIAMGFGGALFAPWFGVVTKRLKRIEGHGPAAAYCQLALGALMVFEIVLPIAVLQVALFRLERPPSETLLLSDLFLILLISPAYTVIIEWLVTGLAILRDQADRPVFPRWIGTVNLLTALASITGVTVIFFKSGSLAWSGLFGFWVPATVFGVWVICMTKALLSGGTSSESRAVDRATIQFHGRSGGIDAGMS